MLEKKHIYLVTQWGSEYDEDGPDGLDTNFIVCSSNFSEAARFVDHYLSQIEHKRIQPHASRVLDMGAGASTTCDNAIVYAPFFIYSYNLLQFRAWHRDDFDTCWEEDADIDSPSEPNIQKEESNCIYVVSSGATHVAPEINIAQLDEPTFYSFIIQAKSPVSAIDIANESLDFVRYEKACYVTELCKPLSVCSLQKIVWGPFCLPPLLNGSYSSWEMKPDGELEKR